MYEVARRLFRFLGKTCLGMRPIALRYEYRLGDEPGTVWVAFRGRGYWWRSVEDENVEKSRVLLEFYDYIHRTYGFRPRLTGPMVLEKYKGD